MHELLQKNYEKKSYTRIVSISIFLGTSITERPSSSIIVHLIRLKKIEKG